MHSVFHMDCVAGMRLMPDATFDSVVTDPPYELGFMGKSWDASGIAYSVEMWREALRVLKPGGHLLAFSGSRTYHRMTCAIEDAGFEIRDQIMWVYGSGFPKSLDVSKAIDKAAGAVREVIGRAAGAGAKDPTSFGNGHNAEYDITAPATDAARQWQGWGTSLKPAHEPICVARKPLAAGTVAANVLEWGTGAINVDGCRVEGGTRPLIERHNQYRPENFNLPSGSRNAGDTTLGRWPANFIHDGLPEEWARFFYCAKSSKADRGANTHPTVKPTDLMRYLCRLVTPPGGTVLDPFTGSGSTGKAAKMEGFNFVGFEMQAEYVAIAQARIAAAQLTNP